MEGHFLVCENAEEEFDISFQVNSTMDSVIPKDQQELYVKAESACNIIKALENTDKQTKKKYFDKLLSLSQVGLVANPAQTETAEFALMKLKDEIVLVEGKRIKNHYMKYLGIDALIIVSAKYCYAAHESRLHQNDRCKRFTLCLVLTVRFRSLAPWGKLFQLFI